MHTGNLEKEIANQVSKLNIQKLGIEENNMTLQQYKTYKMRTCGNGSSVRNHRKYSYY